MVWNTNYFCTKIVGNQGFPGSTVVKNLPSIQETLSSIAGLGRSLEKGMATHSNILAWKFPWTEEPGRLQSLGSQRVWHDWATNTHTIGNHSSPERPISVWRSSPPCVEMSPVLLELFQPRWELLEALLTVGLGHSTWVSLWVWPSGQSHEECSEAARAQPGTS